jgi:hypothetical protein
VALDIVIVAGRARVLALGAARMLALATARVLALGSPRMRAVALDIVFDRSTEALATRNGSAVFALFLGATLVGLVVPGLIRAHVPNLSARAPGTAGR